MLAMYRLAAALPFTSLAVRFFLDVRRVELAALRVRFRLAVFLALRRRR